MTLPGATELRVFVYDTIARRGRPPASTEIGAHFGITPDPNTGEIAIAGPVAANPTPYRVSANGVTWFASSAWDMLGVAAMFQTEVAVDTKCADCGEPLKFFLDRSEERRV